MAKFHSILRDEITSASRKISADPVKGLKEPGHHTNQLEQRMDLATTMLEGDEEEVDKLSAEFENMRDKLEDINDLQGTTTAFFSGTGT